MTRCQFRDRNTRDARDHGCDIVRRDRVVEQCPVRRRRRLLFVLLRELLFEGWDYPKTQLGRTAKIAFPLGYVEFYPGLVKLLLCLLDAADFRFLLLPSLCEGVDLLLEPPEIFL